MSLSPGSDPDNYSGSSPTDPSKPPGPLCCPPIADVSLVRPPGWQSLSVPVPMPQGSWKSESSGISQDRGNCLSVGQVLEARKWGKGQLSR